MAKEKVGITSHENSVLLRDAGVGEGSIEQGQTYYEDADTYVLLHGIITGSVYSVVVFPKNSQPFISEANINSDYAMAYTAKQLEQKLFVIDGYEGMSETQQGNSTQIAITVLGQDYIGSNPVKADAIAEALLLYLSHQ